MLKYEIRELIGSFLNVKAMELDSAKTSHPHLFPAGTYWLCLVGYLQTQNSVR